MDNLIRFEQIRLSTYHFWSLAQVDPADLAKSGFYYTNYKNIVRYFECSLELALMKPREKGFN